MVPAIAHAAQPEDVLRSLWEKTARAGSTRHPFHREVLIDLNTLLDNVAAAAPFDDVNDIPTRWDGAPTLAPSWAIPAAAVLDPLPSAIGPV